jgi:hypothetical protein
MEALNDQYCSPRHVHSVLQRSRAAMTENPLQGQRVHNEAPAEGDPDADPTDIRVHSQDPAEGADVPETPEAKKS